MDQTLQEPRRSPTRSPAGSGGNGSGGKPRPARHKLREQLEREPAADDRRRGGSVNVRPAVGLGTMSTALGAVWGPGAPRARVSRSEIQTNSEVWQTQITSNLLNEILQGRPGR